MPDALSELTVYAQEAGQYLTLLQNKKPSVPTSGLTTLKGVIEHINYKAALRTFELVSWYQIQNSRMISAAITQRKYNPSEHLYDVVLLQAYINSLYDYARNEKKSAPTTKPSVNEMNTAMKNTFTIYFIAKNTVIFNKLEKLIKIRH